MSNVSELKHCAPSLRVPTLFVSLLGARKCRRNVSPSDEQRHAQGGRVGDEIEIIERRAGNTIFRYEKFLIDD